MNIYLCPGNNVLVKEVYRIDPNSNRTEVLSLARWNSTAGLSMSTMNMWERRSNLHQFTFRYFRTDVILTLTYS